MIWLAMSLAMASDDCTSASVSDAGGTLRQGGAVLTVPADLWTGSRTVELCAVDADTWEVHLPVREGTSSRLTTGLILEVPEVAGEEFKQTTRSATDILFTVDRSCSMGADATASVVFDGDDLTVEWTVTSEKTVALDLTLVEKSESGLVYEAE